MPETRSDRTSQAIQSTQSAEPTYSVIFRGDLQPGYTTADVKAHFARLFKAGPDTVEKLFCGRPLAIKKGLNRAQADQLQATLAKYGAQSSLKVEGEPEQPAVALTPEPERETSAAKLTEQNPEQNPEQAQPAMASGAGLSVELSLAPMEGNLLKTHERQQVEPVQVAVSHLSLQAEGGNLVKESERSKEPPVEVEVPDWKLNSTAATFQVPD